MILIILGWMVLNLCLNFIVDKKRARNYVSFAHSLLCSSHLISKDYNSLMSISVSYFIYDLCYIIDVCFYKEWIYAYHHLSCILFLFESHQKGLSLVYNMFCIGELSNFWMYIIYDLLKQGYDKKIIKSLKFVQLLWYAYFRIYRFTWFVIENNQIVLEMKFYNVIGLYSLYFLGIGWTHYQIRQLLV